MQKIAKVGARLGIHLKRPIRQGPDDAKRGSMSDTRGPLQP